MSLACTGPEKYAFLAIRVKRDSLTALNRHVKRFVVRRFASGIERVFSSSATTREVTVEVRSTFMPERSEPERGQWFFAYWVRISNKGSTTVQLMSRHWVITDANGHVEEVRGLGVVGQQPMLAPGESFEYTSFCPLVTSFGTMEGSYQMETQNGEQFDVAIAPFTLAEPKAVN